jgi:hypothetical protein
VARRTAPRARDDSIKPGSGMVAPYLAHARHYWQVMKEW